MSSTPSRRDFLTTSAGALGWLTLGSSPLFTLAACAREDAAVGAPLVNLTPEEGRAMRAFAEQIMPAGDGLPGATDAGAVHFIDRAVGEWFGELRPVVAQAAGALDEEAGESAFADLDFDGQKSVMEACEDEPWFGALRFLVISGVLANPEYGGNVGGAGQAILGYAHRPVYQPPFGAYDLGHHGEAEPEGSAEDPPHPRPGAGTASHGASHRRAAR